MNTFMDDLQGHMPRGLYVSSIQLPAVGCSSVEVVVEGWSEDGVPKPFMFETCGMWYVFQWHKHISFSQNQDYMTVDSIGSLSHMKIPTTSAIEVTTHCYGHRNKDDADAQLMQFLMEI